MATFVKRKDKSGKIKHRAVVRLKGHKEQSATFERLTDAKRWAAQTETEIKQGRYFKEEEAKKHTFAEMADRYILQIKRNNPARYPEIKLQLNFFKSILGHMLLSDVTKANIVGAIEVLESQTRKLNSGESKSLSPSRVNRYMAALSHAYSIAMNEWEWIENNPMSKIKRKNEPRGRVRFLDAEERQRLLTACRDSDSANLLYPLVVLAISTGARKNELLSLKWGDVDFKRQAITLHETKNGERRVCALTGLACDLLRKLSKIPRIDNPYVFPSPVRSDRPWTERKAFENALQRAEIEDFRFHDLRHCAASYLAMNGATLAEIAEVLGHKTLSMVKRYAHLSESHTHSVVARMNEEIFG